MASESFAKGNEAFVAEDYDVADEHYTKAIELDDTRDEYYVARAHARTKLDRFQDANLDATRAVQLNDKSVKAHFRKGVALFNLEDYSSALESFTHAKTLDVRKKTAGMESTDSQVVYGCSLTTSQKPEAAATSVTENSETKPSSPPVIQMPSGPKTKYDWYQTETHVVVTILIKNVKKEDMKTDIQEKHVSGYYFILHF
ncbi:hypothetical protein LSH36_191g03037 [Paralvinella palmiformis]|uniref:CS domain-containing protein n=1 Tax=Paralvinella palmiformis TaxID=53620 RepID=A0AAD9JQQ4_9ANNE|nr:hypothetical protein LSH36_191g03037 [Paralvinella palmiformis]